MDLNITINLHPYAIVAVAVCIIAYMIGHILVQLEQGKKP